MRPALHERRVARCHGCGRVADGVTTSQAHLRAWGQRGRKDFHRCDTCRDAIVERPLAVVLADYVNDQEG